MIKTVILDLGGVYFTNGTKIVIDALSKTYKVPKSRVSEVFKESGDLGGKYRTGKLSCTEFLRRARAFMGIVVTEAKLNQIWLDSYKPIKGTVAIVERLKKAGYELLFLSNNVKERVDYLEDKFRFLQRFDDGILSHIAKAKKPEPKIYKLALKKASNHAGECVYVDDKAELLPPAKKLGMKTIVFKNPNQLELDLKGIGLDF